MLSSILAIWFSLVSNTFFSLLLLIDFQNPKYNLFFCLFFCCCCCLFVFVCFLFVCFCWLTDLQTKQNRLRIKSVNNCAKKVSLKWDRSYFFVALPARFIFCQGTAVNKIKVYLSFFPGGKLRLHSSTGRW